jgi:hypothetical protein
MITLSRTNVPLSAITITTRFRKHSNYAEHCPTHTKQQRTQSKPITHANEKDNCYIPTKSPSPRWGVDSLP